MSMTAEAATELPEKAKESITHPESKNAFTVDAFLHTPIHALQMPTHQLPANIECEPLPLRDNTRRQPCEVAEVAWVEQRV